MALVLPRGEIFLWGRNFCRIILGILAALLAAKTVRNRTKRHKTFTEHCWKSSKNTETCFFTSIKTGVRLTLIRSSTTLLRSVSAYVLHEKAQIQRLIIDQKYTFWCHKVEIKPLNFACFHKNTNILRFIIDQKHTFWCHKLKIKPLNFALFAKKIWWTPPIPYAPQVGASIRFASKS